MHPRRALVLAIALSLACSSSEPDPSSLSGRVVFSQWNAAFVAGLYSMKPDGFDIRLLKREDSLTLFIPRVSPSGNQIAVSGGPANGPWTGEFYLLSTTGQSLRKIALPFGFHNFSWSPDGARLVFECSDPAPAAGEATDAICIVNADGSSPVRINHLGTASYGPTWSPDGLRIAFTNARGLYTMTPTGTDVHLITQSSYTIAQPTWSPDGKLIAYSIMGPLVPPPLDGGLWVIAPDGPRASHVTGDEADCSAWSPDSAGLLFCNRGRLSSIRLDGTMRTPLAEGLHASWVP